MTVQIVPFTTRPEQSEEVEAAVTELFAAIEPAQPDGIRYLDLQADPLPHFGEELGRIPDRLVAVQIGSGPMLLGQPTVAFLAFMMLV